MDIIQALRGDGCGDSDHGSVVKYYGKQAKTEVRCRTNQAVVMCPDEQCWITRLGFTIGNIQY